MTANEIQDKLKKIEQAKERIAKEQGAKELLLKQMKEKYKVSTIEALELLITKKEKELESLETEIEQKSAELKENYPQLFVNG